MSVVIPSSGDPRKLDTSPTSGLQVTDDQVKDASRLARALTVIVRSLAVLVGRWAPKVIDFEDFAVDATGTTVYRFTHKLGARVRWWVIDWSGGSAGPSLVRHSSTDTNTLCLVSYVAGTATIRVEVAG